MNRKLIIILLCITAATAAAVWFGIYYKQTRGKQDRIYSTNSGGYAEEEMLHADSLIVGKWQCAENPQWYKVYYDDYDEEQNLFWGKEWDESEDVQEEDLKYHGNGWFRWNKTGNTLHEYATMDARDVPIHRAYKIRLSTHDSLVYSEPDHKRFVFRFARH